MEGGNEKMTKKEELIDKAKRIVMSVFDNAPICFKFTIRICYNNSILKETHYALRYFRYTWANHRV